MVTFRSEGEHRKPVLVFWAHAQHKAGLQNTQFIYQYLTSSLSSGRTSFYEQYGVIRDVLQNHLTEALMFLTMELPGNLSKAEEVLQCKLQALQSLRGLEKQSVVLGQYQAYASHVQEELQKGQNYISTTPTFAGEFFLLGSGEEEYSRAKGSRR